MAIQKAILLDNNINIPTAYIRVYKVELIYSNPDVCNIGVSIYASSTAYTSFMPEITTIEHKCKGPNFSTFFGESVLSIASNTVLSQAYVYIQTIPFYMGGIIVP